MTAFLRRGAIVVTVLAFAGCAREAPEEVETETVVPVTAAAAQVGAITAVMRVTGVVAPAPGADLIVIAPEPADPSESSEPWCRFFRGADVAPGSPRRGSARTVSFLRSSNGKLLTEP